MTLSRRIGVGAVFLAALVGACESMPDVVQVTIRNNEVEAVTLRQCDVRCNQVHRIETLEPGATLKVNTSTANVPNYWMVVTNGTVVGCVDLLENGFHPQDVFDVTNTVPCPT